MSIFKRFHLEQIHKKHGSNVSFRATPYFDQFISIEWVQREQTKKRMNRSFTLQRQSMPFRKYLYREQEEGAHRFFFTCARSTFPKIVVRL